MYIHTYSSRPLYALIKANYIQSSEIRRQIGLIYGCCGLLVVCFSDTRIKGFSSLSTLLLAKYQLFFHCLCGFWTACYFTSHLRFKASYWYLACLHSLTITPRLKPFALHWSSSVCKPIISPLLTLVLVTMRYCMSSPTLCERPITHHPSAYTSLSSALIRLAVSHQFFFFYRSE